MFLFRDGLFTLVYNVSLIHLQRFWSSLPTMPKVIYGNIVTSGVTMVIDGVGCLEMFFEPLSKSSRGFTSVFLITLHPVTLVSVNDSTFLLDDILVFGEP